MKKLLMAGLLMATASLVFAEQQPIVQRYVFHRIEPIDSGNMTINAPGIMLDTQTGQLWLLTPATVGAVVLVPIKKIDDYAK